MGRVRIECDGILFDNDGVLVDSHVAVEDAWTQLAAEFAIDAEDLLIELVGVRAIDTLARYLSPEQVAVAGARLEDLEVTLSAGVPAVVGARELLGRLPTGSWTVVTSATGRLARARWQGAGLPVPERYVTAEDVVRGKPYPDPYLAGARNLGVEPSRCVVFEDSASGGAAGTAAGATVVAVGELPWSVEPAARIADLSAVIPTVDGRGRLCLELEPVVGVGSRR